MMMLAGLGVILIAAWLLIFSPIQEQFEARLRNYPNQLTSLQQLNRTLLIYKGKEFPAPKISETEFSNIKARLVAQGVQFKLLRLDQTSPAQISLQINEIEFSRWLELMVDFRIKYGLYANAVVVNKNSDNAGVVQVAATLVQSR
jgi:type II secretory pathway component PulM